MIRNGPNGFIVDLPGAGSRRRLRIARDGERQLRVIVRHRQREVERRLHPDDEASLYRWLRGHETGFTTEGLSGGLGGNLCLRGAPPIRLDQKAMRAAADWIGG